MIKRIILILLLCMASVFASDELKYTKIETSSLVKTLCNCDLQFNDMLSVSLDLLSAFVMVDNDLVKNELLNSPKPAHADKSVLTLSYKF